MMVHKEVHRPLDDYLSGRVDLCGYFSPIMPGILDDQYLNRRLERLRLFLHVVGLLDRYVKRYCLIVIAR